MFNRPVFLYNSVYNVVSRRMEYNTCFLDLAVFFGCASTDYRKFVLTNSFLLQQYRYRVVTVVVDDDSCELYRIGAFLGQIIPLRILIKKYLRLSPRYVHTLYAGSILRMHVCMVEMRIKYWILTK